MLCNAIKDLSNIDESKYIYEIKKDGTRVWLYCLNNKIVRAENRRGTDILYKYPELKCLKISLKAGVLDGELCCKDFSTLLSREHLKDSFKIRLSSKKNPITFYAFDILDYNGKILGNLPLMERKKYLEKLVVSECETFRVLPYLTNLKGILNIMKETEAEGIILKEKDSVYVNGRSNSWLKFKKRVEEVIKFDGYEENTDNSLTLTNGTYKKEKSLIRVKCNELNAKTLIDKYKFVNVIVEGLEITKSGKIRMPIVKEVLNADN